jgi:hypothetical protein
MPKMNSFLIVLINLEAVLVCALLNNLSSSCGSLRDNDAVAPVWPAIRPVGACRAGFLVRFEKPEIRLAFYFAQRRIRRGMSRRNRAIPDGMHGLSDGCRGVGGAANW